MLIQSCTVFNLSILFVSVLYCSVESALPEAQMKAFKKQIKNQCVQKTKIDPAMIEGALNGNFPEDHKFECFVKCIMDKSLVDNSSIELFYQHNYWGTEVDWV
ncbi:uncharacterized protein LOC103508759 [Diaphorina citri]|uniref:Uncharacterized protein LOC103508759 n=1 Tax=Diaphorina citri TaxID=121845 RepID=A0A1S3D0C1_DIACI|nr:uncharacterized protein LOC103508759 [Diaphorina citri]